MILFEVIEGVLDILDELPALLVSEACCDGIAAESPVVPSDVGTAVPLLEIEELTVGELTPPEDAVIATEGWALEIRIRIAVAEASLAFPEAVPETTGIGGEIEIDIDEGHCFNP